MPLSAARGNPARALLAGTLLVLLLGLLALVSASDAGVALPGMAGLLADLRVIQRDMHRALVGAVRAAQQDGAAGPWLALLGVSFLYGIFHAAGPGHGKVLISSFLLADGGRLRAGILVSFAAAAVHALSAIALVGILAAMLQLSRGQITAAAGWLDSASYGAIALIGAWMLAGAIRGDAHDHDHGHGHGHHHDHHHGHAHHDHAAPGGSGWRRYAAVAIATGIRPCSGAVLVLLFTLGQGIFAMGIAATFAIALGTGVTVAVIASLTVLSRNTALALAGGDEAQGWRGALGRALAIAGSLAVFALGALLLTASLGGSGPPL